MVKKILSVGCSGQTSMKCCELDAQNMLDLHCTNKYRAGWASQPELFKGVDIIEPVITANDITEFYDDLADADVLHVFWSSHGTTIKENGKKRFAFYCGEGRGIMFDDFLQNFILPLFEYKPKYINIIIDACESGIVKKKIIGRELKMIEQANDIFDKPEEKYVDVVKPEVMKMGTTNANKKLPKCIRLQLASIGGQPALGDLDGTAFNGFYPYTHGMSLYTSAYISAVCNGMMWGVGYKKNTWGYVNQLTNRIMKNTIESLGTEGWLNSAPRTTRQQGSVKAGPKSNKEII